MTNNGNVHNCGSCMPCRINYTSRWTLRLLYELSCWSDASFVTLTYDDEHLPVDRGLHMTDFQLFMKRLRCNLSGRKVRYYHCGEYGSKKKRPHFHAIIFGVSPWSKSDREAVRDSWMKSEAFFFDLLPRDYERSNSPVGKSILPVCREDIAYTCGYVQKKLSGVLAQEEYGDKKRPYSTCSRGIGLDFALKNAERLKANKFTFLNARRIGLPRYIRDKLGITYDAAKDYELKSSELERRTMRVISDKYYASYPDMRGNLSKYAATHFERWYDQQEFDLCAQLERDYIQLNHIRYGLE